MRIVALMTIRNEELYLQRCLDHLYSQGVETCIIDNDSNDRSLEIAETYRDRGVFRIEHLPYAGSFELLKILCFEEKLAQEIHADWFIHHDADEIRESPLPYRTLLEGIQDVDKKGYNAINFDEFVFVPTGDTEAYEGSDYVKEMHYYYYFHRRPFHRINAWKKTSSVINLSKSAGHQIQFDGLKIYPENFILRHYILLSKAHANIKYGRRVFSSSEVEKGWHKDRVLFDAERMILPTRETLCKIDNNFEWDKSKPFNHHPFLTNPVLNTSTGKLKQVLNKIIGRFSSGTH